MDKKLCIPEKHGSEPSKPNCDISGVEFRPLQRYNQKELNEFLVVFWEYWMAVNQEDLGAFVTIPILQEEVEMPLIEAKLYWFFGEGARVQIALNGEDIVGFVIYNEIFGCVMAIRAMYLSDKFIGMGLGKNMIDSVGFKPLKIIFQTRMDHLPKDVLKVTEKHRKIITQDDKCLIWEMDWS